jgi:xylulose-5-phosphate/fructose-6-phosphate phosphoketolase
MDVIDRLPGLAPRAAYVRQLMADARLSARQHTRDAGEDLPEIQNWQWPY